MFQPDYSSDLRCFWSSSHLQLESIFFCPLILLPINMHTLWHIPKQNKNRNPTSQCLSRSLLFSSTMTTLSMATAPMLWRGERLMRMWEFVMIQVWQGDGRKLVARSRFLKTVSWRAFHSNVWLVGSFFRLVCLMLFSWVFVILRSTSYYWSIKSIWSTPESEQACTQTYTHKHTFSLSRVHAHTRTHTPTHTLTHTRALTPITHTPLIRIPTHSLFFWCRLTQTFVRVRICAYTHQKTWCHFC